MYLDIYFLIDQVRLKGILPKSALPQQLPLCCNTPLYIFFLEISYDRKHVHLTDKIANIKIMQLRVENFLI